MTERKKREVATESFVERFTRKAAERENQKPQKGAEREIVSADEEGGNDDGADERSEGQETQEEG